MWEEIIEWELIWGIKYSMLAIFLQGFCWACWGSRNEHSRNEQDFVEQVQHCLEVVCTVHTYKHMVPFSLLSLHHYAQAFVFVILYTTQREVIADLH